MVQHKDFDAARRERAEAEQGETTTFTFAGEVFTLQPTLPFGAVADFFVAQQDGSDFKLLPAARDVIVGCVLPEQQEAMRRALQGADIEDAVGIVQWIMEVRTGRPTEPSSASPDGRSSTGALSSSSSSETAST